MVGVGERLGTGVDVGAGEMVGAGVSTGGSDVEGEIVATCVDLGFVMGVKPFPCVAVRVLSGVTAARLGTSMMMPPHAEVTMPKNNSTNITFRRLSNAIDFFSRQVVNKPRMLNFIIGCSGACHLINPIGVNRLL